MQSISFLRSFSILLLIGLIVIIASSSTSLAAEKLRFGTPTKTSPHHNLIPLAAEEKGFWKQMGLEVQWTRFTGGGPMFRALSGGHVDMGISATTGPIQAISRGVPLIIVGDTHFQNYRWFLYVLTKSPIKKGSDLKGGKLAVNRFGGTAHAFARVLVSSLGLEGTTRIIAVGGVAQEIASLKSGAADAIMLPLVTIAPLKFRGEVREVASVSDYLPKPWSDHVIVARNGFAAAEHEAVRKGLQALLMAVDFIHKNKDWTTGKMVSFSRYSPETAGKIAGLLRFGEKFTVDGKAIENVRDFLKQYGIIKTTPSVDQLFTNKFTR